MTAREALEIATLGGAKVLGRDDIGALAPGMAADFVAFDLRGVGHAGALHDPVAALVFCQPGAAVAERDRWPGADPRRPVHRPRTRAPAGAPPRAGAHAV